MKQRIIIPGMLAVCLFVLTGCQCQHEWIAADCLTPKTCARCEETEGEVLGHSWAEASCAVPKTCTICAETEGETLAHTFTGGNYQDPEVCESCGAEGETLLADFEKYGMKINLQENVETDYTSHFFLNDSRVDTAKLLLSNYRTFDSDETHAHKDGYEWKAVDIRIHLDVEETLRPCDTAFAYHFEDYYAIVPFEDSVTYAGDVGIAETVIHYHGETLPVYLEVNYGSMEADYGYFTFTTTVYAQQPVGYDGLVLWFRDFSIPWAMGQYLYDVADENTLYFRMD